MGEGNHILDTPPPNPNLRYNPSLSMYVRARSFASPPPSSETHRYRSERENLETRGNFSVQSLCWLLVLAVLEGGEDSELGADWTDPREVCTFSPSGPGVRQPTGSCDGVDGK